MKKKIIQTTTFKNSYKELVTNAPKLKKSIIDATTLFDEDRENSVLRDHALEGVMICLRSFSVTPNIRILYLEKEDKIIFLNIGTHKQIYKR